MWNNKYKEILQKKRDESIAGGGEKRIAKQHEKGKMTARERINCLVDEGTFEEIGSLMESRISDFGMEKKKIPGDGVVTGYGIINGRLVCISSEDFTVIGGTLGEYHAQKISQIMDKALEWGVPFISINDSGGARIEEGVSSLFGYGSIFYRHTRASGIIPQIAVIMGPCAGGACYAPAICDFIFMTEQAGRMFITGPGVVKEVTGEKVTDMELGGAQVHMTQSGVTHFSYPDDVSCLNGVKQLLSYLPQNCNERPPKRAGKTKNDSERLQEIVPDNYRKGYDVHKVINLLVDEDSFFEIQEKFGQSMVVGLARLDSEVIGILASQPMYMGGALDIDASEKSARFVRFCDSFQIPILTLVDVPGFMPGIRQEHGGIIRRGAKLLYAYSEAVVPKVTLIMRKAFGGAYIAMNSKGMGADLVYAWPLAQIAVMGAEGAVDIIFHKELAESADREKERETRVEEYNEKFMNPYIAAGRGYIDEVILPEETRHKLSNAFETLKSKKLGNRKIHGNIPL